MERGASWATVHGVTKSRTQLSWTHFHQRENIKAYPGPWEFHPGYTHSNAIFYFWSFLLDVDCYFVFSFLYLFAALGLHYSAQAFSSCGPQASHCGGFSCCEARALRQVVVVV